MEERHRAYFETIGARIRRVRTERGMTMAELADRAGVTPSYIGLIEHGKRAVRLKVLLGISEALDVPLPVLVDKSPDVM